MFSRSILCKITKNNNINSTRARVIIGSLSTLSSSSSSSSNNNDKLALFGSAAIAGLSLICANNNNTNNTNVMCDSSSSASTSSPSPVFNLLKEIEDVPISTGTTPTIEDLQPHDSQVRIDSLPSNGNHNDNANDNNNMDNNVNANVNEPSTSSHSHTNVMTKKMYFYKAPRVQDYMQDKFKIYAGPSTSSLAKDVAHLLGTKSNDMSVGQFADGETAIKLEEEVRGKHVFVLHSTTTVDSVMEVILMVTCLRRASAKRVTLVLPYYGYSRQDRKHGQANEPIAAADLANMFEVAGVDHVMCMDLHNDAITGCFAPKTPVDTIGPGPVAAAYFHEELSNTNQNHKITVVAAHEGQVERAVQFSRVLKRLHEHEQNGEKDKNTNNNIDIKFACIIKPGSAAKQNNNNSSAEPFLIGDVHDRKCILVDDMIDTGKTLHSAIHTLHDNGATEIYAWATHGLFGKRGHEDEGQDEHELGYKEYLYHNLPATLKYILVSNSVMPNTNDNDDTRHDTPSCVRHLNVAPLLAEAIARTLHDQSISSILSSLVENTPPARYDV